MIVQQIAAISLIITLFVVMIVKGFEVYELE